MKLYATIRQTDIHPPTRHFVGLPTILHPDGVQPKAMAWPRVLVIYSSSEGVFLDRFAEDGTSAGDTWHQSVDDAKAQAGAEYEDMLSEWHRIPPEVGDGFIEYALARAHGRDGSPRSHS